MSTTATGNRQHLQVSEVAYTTQASAAALAAPTNAQLFIHSASAYNATGSGIGVALGVRLNTSAWKLWTVQGANADATAAIQAGSAVSILPTTNNYGFIVQCKEQFSLLSMTVSQAEAGSPVYSYQYWNGAAWATLNTVSAPVYTSTAAIALAFVPPVDWAQGNGSAISNLVSGNAGYCIRVRGTTAPSTAVQINALQVSKFWAYRSVPPFSHLEVSFSQRPFLMEAGEAIQPFFATANNANSVEISWQAMP